LAHFFSLYDDMSVNNEEEIPAAQDNVESRQAYFKLQDFWTEAPHAWFGIIESQFRLRRVTSQEDRFALVAAVLPEPVARKLTHLLSAPPDDCYTALKAALLSTCQLTEMQKAERLFTMEDLGSRRPSDFLAEMRELVQPGDDRTHLFAMLFLCRLPESIRSQLTEDDHANLTELASKADRIAAALAKRSGQSSFNVASASYEVCEEQEECTVAGVGKPAYGSRFRGKKQKWSGQPRQQQQPAQQQPAQQQQPVNLKQQARSTESPADFARLTTGLCFYHFNWGAKSRSCRAPCSWQGN
jgi:hypothetical protein